jgi:ABC-type multidrug transport system fused ATPase/permease subunit
MSEPVRGNRMDESEFLSNRETLAVIGRALRYIRPFRSRFAVKLALMLTSLVPMLMLPWPVKIIVDNVIQGRPIDDPIRPYPNALEPLMSALAGFTPFELLAVVIGFQVALFLVIGAFGTSGAEGESAEGYLASGFDTASRTENEANSGFSLTGGLLGIFDFRWTMRLTQAFNHHYRTRLFDRIQTLPMTAFDDERIGDAVYRVMYDTPTITSACYRILLTPVTAPLHILMTVAILSLLFGDQPILVGSALAFLPLALLATLPFASALRRDSGRSRKAGATATSTAEEGMSNILAVQSLGGEDQQRDRYEKDSWSAFSRYRAVFRLGIYAVVLAAIPGIFIIGYAFLHAIDLVIAEEISVGDFALLTTYFFHVLISAQSLGGLWFGLQASAAGLHRVFFLMDMPGETDDPMNEELATIERGVAIEKVEFAYPDGTPALRAVELYAKIGEIIAFVGPAGAGKTTLAYLIPRFITPDRGRVLIDGTDISTVTLDSLRRQIAFVFQETVLFDATVAENIRMGLPGASDEAVREAARLAGASEFIDKLPQGYATPLGRAGGKLSVGQKQRLSLARALVRDARILILDEPTSALDPETERRFVTTLREVSRDRLVIVIAHRMSTVRAADQILFVDGGAITERGTHAQLLERPDGGYRRFVEMQSGPGSNR